MSRADRTMVGFPRSCKGCGVTFRASSTRHRFHDRNCLRRTKSLCLRVVRLCEGCSKNYIPRRRDQRFCETKCARRGYYDKRYHGRMFGMAEDEYETLVRAQAGRCAICRGLPRAKKRLAVDHNHKTGRIRGLLCVPCNAAIGWLGDEHDALLRAVAYLAAADRAEDVA